MTAVAHIVVKRRRVAGLRFSPFVFDFGPAFGARARVGQSIPLVPPFGAVFVAWDPTDAEQWKGIDDKFTKYFSPNPGKP